MAMLVPFSVLVYSFPLHLSITYCRMLIGKS
nr:MAG TPA: hypothetical protein [Caudoviricetes sp.]